MATAVIEERIGNIWNVDGIGRERERMWLIVLEAVGALALLVFVVWWTMFSGRRGGELPPGEQAPSAADAPAAQDVADRGGSKKLKG